MVEMGTILNGTILALTIFLGREGEHWIYALVDEVEWTHPKYNHQN